MYKKYDDKIFLKLLIGLIIIAIVIRIFLPIINPTKATAEGKYNQQNFYQQIIDKSNMLIEVAMDEEDEDKKGLFQGIFQYVTNIDIDNPKSYLAYQIPILRFINIPSLSPDSDEPIVVVPTEDNKKEDNTQTPNKNTQKNTPPDSTDVKRIAVIDNQNIKKRKFNLQKPLILIYHTHTRENYNPDNIKDKLYSSDLNGGVCRVGEKLRDELQNVYGIPAIHDMTIHDLPTRSGAYAKSRPTVQNYLKKYPSLKIIIDLHRDGGVKRNTVTAIINNKRYARVMLVVGMKNPGYQKKMELVKKIHNTFQSMYPGYCREIRYNKNGKYNQDLSGKIVLIELGSNENSLDEAVNAAKIIAKVLAKNIN